MTPDRLRAGIIADRAGWTREMLAGLRALPLESLDAFAADARTPAAAESFLRRALEALLDLGRHVLAKGFGRAAAQYKDIADGLVEAHVLDSALGARLKEMAGYRNRLVHFYDRVTVSELFQICTERSGDIEAVLNAILGWVRADPERVDGPFPI